MMKVFLALELLVHQDLHDETTLGLSLFIKVIHPDFGCLEMPSSEEYNSVKLSGLELL